MEIDFTTCRNRLQELSMVSSITPIKLKAQELYVKAREIGNSFDDTFTYQGCDVLKMKYDLAKIKCPMKVHIVNLSSSIHVFKTKLKAREAETISFRTTVHSFVEECRVKKLKTEKKKRIAREDISILERQIQNSEEVLERISEEISKITRAAYELEARALDLDLRSNQQCNNGYLWGLLTASAGIVLGVFTGRATVLAGMAVAGIVLKVNLDSAHDSKLNATRLRRAADDKTHDIIRHQNLRDNFKREKKVAEQKLRKLEGKLDNLAKTENTLGSIEQFLCDLIRKIGQIAEVVQILDLKLHDTGLQNDTLKMLQELSFEDEQMYSEIADDCLSELKIKWTELEEMLLPYYIRRFLQ